MNLLPAYRRILRHPVRHWTPRYVMRRCANIASNMVHPNWPWLTPQAVRYLDASLKPAHHAFEWGAGRSTLWIAERVRSIISVEHDPAWYARVQSLARRRHLRNIHLKFCPDGPARPDDLAYLTAILKAAQEFDFVLVDGLYRDHCALAALTRLKPQGVLVLDNANWYLPSNSSAPSSRSLVDGPASLQWAEFARRVSGWKTVWTSNGVTDTTLWVKQS
jgi:predicted O-methyltransferase YrrM